MREEVAGGEETHDEQRHERHEAHRARRVARAAVQHGRAEARQQRATNQCVTFACCAPAADVTIDRIRLHPHVGGGHGRSLPLC